LLPLLPAHTHPESQHTQHPTWLPNASTFPLFRAWSPLLPYPTPLSLPPLGGGVIRPLHSHRSLGTMPTAATFIVVVVIMLLSYWLSCWLSCCCCPSSRVIVVATAAAATAEPPTCSCQRHRRCHLHCRCRHNHIHCSYHRRPHLAAAFTAVVSTRLSPPPPHRRRKFPQRSYRWLSPLPRPPPSSLPSLLHSLQPSLPPSLSPSPQPPPKQPNFLARCKIYRGI
jgi:hypothetical protein